MALKRTAGLTMPAKIIITVILIAAIFFEVKYAKLSGLIDKAQEKIQNISKIKKPQVDVIIKEP